MLSDPLKHCRPHPHLFIVRIYIFFEHAHPNVLLYPSVNRSPLLWRSDLFVLALYFIRFQGRRCVSGSVQCVLVVLVVGGHLLIRFHREGRGGKLQILIVNPALRSNSNTRAVPYLMSACEIELFFSFFF